MDAPPEPRINRYVLHEPIGKGGMGDVFRAFDPRLRRHLALKLVRGVANPRLLREAQAMAQLSHPNVVQVYDAGITGDRVFIAMELVEGADLRTWLSAPRPWQAVLDVFTAAGRGLAAAHAAGIVHRDFKPSNALVSSTGRVVVGDFGLARPAGVDDLPAGGAIGEATRPTLTLSGPGMGTPKYMAPEQRTGNRVDARADQYSFCVALHDALVAAGAPQRVRDVVFRGMAPDPESRFATIDELLDALARAREAEPGGRRNPWLAVSAAAVAAAAVAVFASVGPTRTPASAPASADVTAHAPQPDPEPVAVDDEPAPGPEIEIALPSESESEPEPESHAEPEAAPAQATRSPSRKRWHRRAASRPAPKRGGHDPDGLIRDLWSDK